MDRARNQAGASRLSSPESGAPEPIHELFRAAGVSRSAVTRRMIAPGGDPGPRSGAPVVVGVGGTGLKIVALLAARERRSLRCFAVLPGPPPTGPAPVPVVSWPSTREASAGAARELAERAAGAGGAVLACYLGAASVDLAPDVARALRRATGTCAAVGLEPFAFEGPERNERARATSAALRQTVDLLAVAERERVRAIVPSDTPLDAACDVVDEIAASAAAALARTLGRRDAGAPGGGVSGGFRGAASACPIGAAEATGPQALSAAVRAAVEGSLLSARSFAASRGACLAIAVGRTPTLGELSGAEALVRAALPQTAPAGRGARRRSRQATVGEPPVTVEIAVDQALGSRAIAAVLCLPAAEREEGVFPAEDPAALEIPAFMRKRAAGADRPAGLPLGRGVTVPPLRRSA